MKNWSQMVHESRNWDDVLIVASRDSCIPIAETDLAEVIAASDGEDDGPDWLAVARHQNGQFVMVRAGCCYTGWGCQDNGDVEFAESLAMLRIDCMTREEEMRLFGTSVRD